MKVPRAYPIVGEVSPSLQSTYKASLARAFALPPLRGFRRQPRNAPLICTQHILSFLLIALFFCLSAFISRVTFASEVEEEAEILDFEFPASDAVSDTRHDVTTLPTIEVYSHLPTKDLGKGSFEQNLRTQGLSNISQVLEESPLVVADSSSKGQRKLYLRGFDIRQISFQFEDIPLDTGYDAIIGLDTLPINWLGSIKIKTTNSNIFDELGLGAGIDISAIRAPLFEARLDLEPHGFSLSAAHGHSTQPYAWDLSAGISYSKGFSLARGCTATVYEDCGLRNNTDKKSANIFGRFERKIGTWGELTVMSGWNRESKGVPIGMNTAIPRFWRFPLWDISLNMARLQFANPKFYGQIQSWFTYQGNTLNAYDDESYSSQLSLGAFNSKMRDFDAGILVYGASNPYKLGKLGLIDFRLRSDLRYQYHDAESESALEGDSNASTSRIMLRVKPGFYWKILSELEIFADASFWGNFEITKPQTALSNVELTNRYNGAFTFGVDYLAHRTTQLSFRIARRLRMPTLKEQFVQVLHSSNIRYKELNAEYNLDFQMQLRYKPLEELEFSLTGFDSEIRDLINFAYVGELRQAVNIDKARIAGLTLLAKIGPYWGFNLNASYYFAIARDLKNQTDLLERPNHTLQFKLNYQLQRFSLGVDFQYESSRLSDDWTGDQYRRLGAIYLLGANISYQLDNVFLSLRATNLLDMYYQRSYGYPEAGRSFFFQAKISL